MEKEQKQQDTHVFSARISIFFIVTGILMGVQVILGILFYSDAQSDILRYFGLFLWIILLIFGWLPVIVLKRKGDVPKGKRYDDTQKLVQTGIYAIVRHPQYVSFMLLNISIMFIAQHWLVILVGVVGIVLEYLIISDEEKYLRVRFGKSYENYMKNVPQINFVWGILRVFVKRMEALLGE